MIKKKYGGMLPKKPPLISKVAMSSLFLDVNLSSILKR